MAMKSDIAYRVKRLQRQSEFMTRAQKETANKWIALAARALFDTDKYSDNESVNFQCFRWEIQNRIKYNCEELKLNGSISRKRGLK